MRGGYFLAEASPESLMMQYGAESLEDVFLKLSVIQNQGKRRRSSIAQVVVSHITVPSGVVNEAAVIDDERGEISGEFGDNISMSSRGGRVSTNADISNPPPELPPDEDASATCADHLKVINFSHMHALIWKNFLWMWRNISVMLFILVLPICQIILFCMSIGHDPEYLPVSVVNYELEHNETCHVNNSCDSTRLSCNFLDYLEKRTLQLTYYDSLDKANNRVRDGLSWATVAFKHNFSEAVRARLEMGRSVHDEDLWSSEVDIYQDISSESS